MATERNTYPIEIAGIYRELTLIVVQPGLRIAVLNILGDTELVQACAKALAQKIKNTEYDVLVTAEAKSIPLALLDDVISTGSTLEGMKQIVQKANGTITAEAAILTEGDQARWEHIVSLGHLPLFTTDYD
jgi:adenine phosphoribosyltransferase